MVGEVARQEADEGGYPFPAGRQANPLTGPIHDVAEGEEAALERDAHAYGLPRFRERGQGLWNKGKPIFPRWAPPRASTATPENPRNAHWHGFIAATRMKSAGKVVDRLARAMVTVPLRGAGGGPQCE